jgi:IS30 family transposase
VKPFPPFTHVGLDNFGPLFATEGTSASKKWVSLFTCLTTRAVHLELVESQSAEHFLTALRRLIAVRGLPGTVVRDNASQFKCIAGIFKELEVKSIKFDFIPAFAPWQGGVYERMVQTVKACLKKTLGRARVSSDQLRTILTEVAAIVNSRPLICVGESATVLTPASFLQLNPRTTLVDKNLH